MFFLLQAGVVPVLPPGITVGILLHFGKFVIYISELYQGFLRFEYFMTICIITFLLKITLEIQIRIPHNKC